MAEHLASRREQIPLPRPMVPAAKARVLLVDSAIATLQSGPFTAATAREITERAGLSLPTISRNFGSMEGLFVAVADELLQRAVGRLAVLQDVSIFTDPDLILRTRLIAWLVTSGAEPTQFRAQIHETLARRIQDEVGQISERTSAAWITVVSLALEGWAVLGSVHELSDEAFIDGVNLFRALREVLPAVERGLGWNRSDER